MRHRLHVIAPATLLLLGLFAGAAQAHPGHGTSADFWSGLLHPMTGIDHLLAMFAVGFWSAFRGPGPARSALTLPLLFVCGAVLGTGLGLAGWFDGRIEIAVAASLLPLGAALLTGVRGSQGVALVVVALCGVLHGAAHGRELAQSASIAALAGFLLGTALLQGIGAGLSRVVPGARRRYAVGGVGGGLAAAGVWLLA